TNLYGPSSDRYHDQRRLFAPLVALPSYASSLVRFAFFRMELFCFGFLPLSSHRINSLAAPVTIDGTAAELEKKTPATWTSTSPDGTTKVLGILPKGENKLLPVSLCSRPSKPSSLINSQYINLHITC